MRYIGVDLAWSDERGTGIAVLADDGRVESSAYLTALDAIAGFCLARGGEGPAILAVDAPLAVPNRTGHREMDRAVMRLFGGRRLGVHAANRDRLERCHGGVRGETLLSKLGGGFRPVRELGGGAGPEGETGLAAGAVVEVYPHAALMAWFDLPSPLSYKRGPVAKRREGLARLVRLLRQLKDADPPLDVDSAPWLPEEGAESLRGAQLQQVESLLDAVVAAHVASFCRRWGASRCACLREATGAGLLTPLPPGRRRSDGE